MGWRPHGGHHCFDYSEARRTPGQLATRPASPPPIIEYNNCTAKPNGCKGISVTGGYVYRGFQ